jgi:hypothetical protein
MKQKIKYIQSISFHRVKTLVSAEWKLLCVKCAAFKMGKIKVLCFIIMLNSFFTFETFSK